MLELKKTPEHTIDRVFLLALLALFAATAFLVVSIGAKQYHSIADSMTAIMRPVPYPLIWKKK